MRHEAVVEAAEPEAVAEVAEPEAAAPEAATESGDEPAEGSDDAAPPAQES